MATDDARPLPSYTDPPVIEAYLGVEFDVHPWLSPTNLFAAWEIWRESYPQVSVQQPGPSFPNLGVGLIHLGPPPIRLWMLDTSGNHLVQLQEDRLLLNWRRLTSDEGYPRFDSLLPEYLGLWTSLTSWLAQRTQPPPTCRVVEMGYVNSVPLGLGGMAEALTWLAEAPPASTGQGSITFAIERPLPAGIGVTNIVAASLPDHTMQLTVTTRLPLAPGGHDLEETIKLAHSLSVWTFTDSTRTSKHKEWGRES